MFQIFTIKNEKGEYLKTLYGKNWSTLFDYALIWTNEKEAKQYWEEEKRELGNCYIAVFDVQEVAQITAI